LEALRDLKSQGHILCLVSGRGRESLETFDQVLGDLPEIICLLNGQLIYQDGIVVYENAIPVMDIQNLFQQVDNYGFAYGGYDWNGIIVNRIDGRVEQVWNDFHAELPEVHKNLSKSSRIFQGQLYITVEESKLFGDLLDDYLTNWSHEFLVNLIHKEAGKDKSINWCLAHFGIKRSNSYGFGDGYNDIDMFNAVGHGIAVEGAYEPLQKIAEYITDTPDEDGIANALRHYGFIK